MNPTVNINTLQFNSKHFIHPKWGNYITLRQACEKNKTRMDHKLRQGYKHTVKKKTTYGYAVHNNTLLPNRNINTM